MITTKVSLQLVDQTVPAIIPVVQGDTGRSIIFEPSDFTIPEGATATYYIQKPSGEAVYNSAEITGNTVVCNLTAQSIIETGENNMQVRIILGEDIVTSFDAILMVRPFRGIGAVESKTEINIFDKAVEQAEQEISDKADEIIAEKVPELEAIVEEVIESIPADYTALTNKVAAMLADMATEFSAEATYQPGDIVIYENDLYRKKNGPNITGEWIAAQWEAITLGSAIEQIVGNLAPQYDQTATYHKDDAVIYLGDLYICTSTLSVTGTWDASKWSKTDVSSLAPAVDATLTQQGKPADAKKVGDEITDVKADLAQIEPGLSDAAKTALLNCFQHVAWTDDHGQDYYNVLESALYADVYPRITATFEAGTNPIYTDDSIDSLKAYLTVKYFETKDSSGTTIANGDYTVSGTLTEGTSTITVSYNDLRTTVNVSGVINYYGIKEWSVENGLLHIIKATVINRTDGNVALADVDMSTNRRTACTTRGAHRLINNYTSEETDWYAIPVPEDATAFTVGVTPNTQFTGTRFWKYNESTNLYESLQNVGWKQGEFTGTINAPGRNLIFTINTKYDSSGSNYPTEPTNIYVTFE